MSKTPEEGSIYYFAGVDKVRFKNSVGPGEIIDLHASICSEKRGIWKFNCRAEVGKVKMSVMLQFFVQIDQSNYVNSVIDPSAKIDSLSKLVPSAL